MNIRNNEVCLLYSESDKAIASLLTDALNYYSIDIWQAQNIAIGSQIISETTKVLEKAKFVIVLWSNNSVKSALLKDLATEAKKNNKVLIPVLIEGIKIPGEFLDIQPANLVGWDGDRENEQIVKLWRLIQDKVLKSRKRNIEFNQLVAIIGLILTGIGLLFTITTPEVRCFLKLQCPENSSRESNIKSSEVTSQLPVESNLPKPELTPLPQSSTATPPNKISIPIFNDNNNTSQQEKLSVSSVELEGVVFKLQSCKRLNTNINCEILITNTLKDRELTLYASYGINRRSKFLDLDGNTYLVQSIEIDALKKTLMFPRNLFKMLIRG